MKRSWIGIVMTLALACGAPSRPANVPEGAFWAGKRSNGVFVLMGERDGLGWQVKLYDRKGNLKAQGPYVLRGMAKAKIVPEEVISFDGEALHLADGTLLVPRR
ncbi:MAG: hypothetical protein LWX11_11425 [Firmicutes bacterium]|nr:hypothetical protein [Bacillota bacterium]